MDLIGKCYTLNDAQQRKFAARAVKQVAMVFGGVFAAMTVLFLLIKMPAALLGSILPMLLLVLGIIIVLRYFVVMKMATGYMLCFDDDMISATYDRKQVGTVVTGMSKLSEARYGTQMNQGIYWRHIDYIKVNSGGMKIYSTKYDLMNGNGRIEVPAFVDDYEQILNYFRLNYSKKIIS